MSTILKALRRLEAEQTGATKSAPPPETPRRKPDRPRGRALWLALAIGGALGFGGAALWTFFGPSAAPDPVPAKAPTLTTTRPSVPPPTQRAPKPNPAPGTAVPAIELAAPPADPPALRPPVPKPAAKAAVRPTPTRAARAVPKPAVRDAPVRKAATPEAAPLATPRAETLDSTPEASPKPAPTPTPQSARIAAPAPVVHAVADPAPPLPSEEEPSPVERPLIPHVVVAQTQWHPDQALRRASVELEGRDTPLILRIGDAVGPLIVTRIEPSAVVFRMGDVEIRRRVGER